ncbi:MAG: ATP-binding protein, partial [Chloroflexota bacterium]
GCQANMVVYSDREVLQQVINNIVSNAIKYSPLNTQITFAVMETERDVGLAITDQGQGLSLDDKEKLFSKYTKLSATPTGGEKSTGLGLYITKRLMVTLGGTVQANSPGKGMGSTFTIFIPKSKRFIEHGKETSRLLKIDKQPS